MLTLCPNHPHAAQLREASDRSQAENAAEAAGELIHAGTFLVNTEIKPGTATLPAKVLCDLLGLSVTGAVRWTNSPVPAATLTPPKSPAVEPSYQGRRAVVAAPRANAFLSWTGSRS